MRRSLWPALLALIILATPATAGKHVALVVGVKSYDLPNMGLNTPEADAAEIAKVLKDNLKFDKVVMLPDTADNTGRSTTRASILAQWDDLVGTLRDDDIVVLYFAGHGIELKGRAYLLPRDVNRDPEQNEELRKLVRTTGELTQTAIDLAAMISTLATKQRTHKHIIGVFIIDACRENPLPFQPDTVDMNPVGLEPSEFPPEQVFMIYSASMGKKAIDGYGGRRPNAHEENSIFASALLDVLANRDIPLARLAQRVRLDVLAKSMALKTKFPNVEPQIPAIYDQLSRGVTLSGDPEDPQNYIIKNGLTSVTPKDLRHGDSFIECTLCPQMVVLRPDEFTMGSPKAQKNASLSEQPPHRVTIAKRFAIGRFHVTNADWDACVADDDSCPGPLRTSPKTPNLDGRPVTNISWEDAVKYTAWLNKVTGKAGTYRLPTEAEWEYAARAGSTDAYFFGDTDVDKRICDYANGADLHVGLLPYANRGCDDGVARETSMVGRYKPNKFGLHDMAGNAWQWVLDCWHASYEGKPPELKSSEPWVTGDKKTCAHVARGGSWRSGLEALRSAGRTTFDASHRRGTLGFRVARSMED